MGMRVVKTLPQRDDVNPNEADEFSRTPLSEAAFNEHERVA